MFPKFSSRARGAAKAANNPVPPPHTTKLLSRCAMEIGPHTFSEVAIYEVHYVANMAPSTEDGASVWQTAQYTASSIAQSSQSLPNTTSQTGPNQTSHFNSPFSGQSTVTPELVAQFNEAAAQNPILASYIQLATIGQATPEQIKILAAFIDSLGVATAPQPHTGAREHDIILEFKESPFYRWLLPKVPIFCESPTLNGSQIDFILLSMALPFHKEIAATEPASSAQVSQPQQQEVVTLRFIRPTKLLYDALISWTGGLEKMEEHRETLKSIVNRSFD
jgi:hypothetical protein